MFELFLLATVTVITRTSSTEILQKELNFGWLTATTTQRNRGLRISLSLSGKKLMMLSLFFSRLLTRGDWDFG